MILNTFKVIKKERTVIHVHAISLYPLKGKGKVPLNDILYPHSTLP